MTDAEILLALDPKQEFDACQSAAIITEKTAVVTAGAGSGKTKVLANRYAYLILKHGLSVENILTMTFTDKAVNEMYSRIYQTLYAHSENENACAAIRNFNKANIKTFDSFCAQIARIASPRFGIPSDFTVDNEGVKELAVNTALPFVLAHRENKALQQIISEHTISTVTKELFADSVLDNNYSLCRNADYTCEHENSFFNKQKNELETQWKRYLTLEYQTIADIQETLTRVKRIDSQGYIKTQAVYIKNHLDGIDLKSIDKNIMQDCISAIKKYTDYSMPSSLPKDDDELRNIRPKIVNLKLIYTILLSIANTFFQLDTVKDIFALIAEFRDAFNAQKRAAGILTFSDVSALALEALTHHTDIRDMYKKQFTAIMCDEFQDNNSLQKDILFLLSEKLERTAKTIPTVDELIDGKLFFVGDEKQSIYRFRGADVSVFRSLSDSISNNLNLGFNYRSAPKLIDAFNFIFHNVFLPKDKNTPYEAVYTDLHFNEKSRTQNIDELPIQFYFIEEDQIPNDPFSPTASDIEAIFIAKKIHSMVEIDKTKVRERIKDTIILRECRYSDFAILQRTRTHQKSFEKQFKNIGVPYNAETPYGLFYDAPVNDLLNILRLIVYPNDSIAYAALLRSPFIRLSDTAFLLCMFQTGKEPFDKSIQDQLPEDEQHIYITACDFYNAIKKEAERRNIAELISILWYDYGYRYETIWSSASQNFAELFDYFFEIARFCDKRNKSLSEFLDYVDALKKQSLKLENIDIPLERSEGVQFLSIHKSKGLEYPIVFIPGCSSTPKPLQNAGLVYYNNEFGPCINLPSDETLQDEEIENYFFNKEKLNRQLMETAELRRLLYVAMTRAETKLFISGILPKLNKNEADANPDIASLPLADRMITRFTILQDARSKKMQEIDFGNEKYIKGYTIPSFFEILLKPLCRPDAKQYFSINTIPIVTQTDIKKTNGNVGVVSILEKAHTAKPFYEIETYNDEVPKNFYLNASKLNVHTSEETEKQTESDSIDNLLKKCEITNAEFGTIVHSAMQSVLTTSEMLIPKNILIPENEFFEQIMQIAKEMGNGFLQSDIGTLAKNAIELCETEYSFLTLIENGDKKIYVSGQIDLLFASEETLFIVDFKTDKIEEPAIHKEQLALYKRAASGLFPQYKTVKTYLYYPRTGNRINMEKYTASVDIEQTALFAVQTALKTELIV